MSTSLASRLQKIQLDRVVHAFNNLEKKIKKKIITTFSVQDLEAARDIIVTEYANHTLNPRIENKSIREAYIAMQTKINKILNNTRARSRFYLRHVDPHLGNQGSSPRASRSLSPIGETPTTTTAVGGRKTRRRSKSRRSKSRKSKSRKNRKSQRRPF